MYLHLCCPRSSVDWQKVQLAFFGRIQVKQVLSNPDTKETLHSNCINPAHHLRGACLNVSLYNISTNSWPSSGKLKILFYSDFSDKFIPGGWLFRDNLFYSNLSIFCSYCVFMQVNELSMMKKRKLLDYFRSSKFSHYPSRPVLVPELFFKYPTRPVPSQSDKPTPVRSWCQAS